MESGNSGRSQENEENDAVLEISEEDTMSVVIIGGHECMVSKYEEICAEYGCKAKVLVKEKGGIRKKIGKPDLMILFTSTVSHKMVNNAVSEAKQNNVRIERVRSSSAAALHHVLSQYCSIQD